MNRDEKIIKWIFSKSENWNKKPLVPTQGRSSWTRTVGMKFILILVMSERVGIIYAGDPILLTMKRRTKQVRRSSQAVRRSFFSSLNKDEEVVRPSKKPQESDVKRSHNLSYSMVTFSKKNQGPEGKWWINYTLSHRLRQAVETAWTW